MGSPFPTRLFATSLFLVFTASAAAEEPAVLVRYDLGADRLDRSLPFDEPFLLLVPAPPSVLHLELDIWRQPETGCNTRPQGATRLPSIRQEGPAQPFRFEVPRLRGRAYCLSFRAESGWTPDIPSAMRTLAESLPLFIVGQGQAPTIDSVRAAVQKEVPAASPSLAKDFAEWAVANPAFQESAVAFIASYAAIERIRATREKLAEHATALGAPHADAIRQSLANVKLAEEALRTSTKAEDVAILTGAVDALDQRLRDVDVTLCAQPSSARCKNTRRHIEAASALRPAAEEVGLRRVLHSQKYAVFLQQFGGWLDEKNTGANTTQNHTIEAGVGVSRSAGGIAATGAVGAVVPMFIDPSDGRFDADVALFAAVNVYPGPVDRDVPLDISDGFSRRFFFSLGLTINRISDAAGTVDGVVAGRALMLGAGLRLTDQVELGAGAALFRQSSPNPAVRDRHLGVAPYIALSVDLDVIGILAQALNTGRGLAL